MTATPEFFNVQPVQKALETLFQHWKPAPPTEQLDPRWALGRTLAATVFSPIDLPEFPRSTVDGYAVRARDTFGASQSLPAYLQLAGQIRMGQVASLQLQPHQAIEIYTGGMLPANADSVIMIENTQPINQHEIEVLSPVAPGENAIHVGEDMTHGSEILPIGAKLRPQDVGGLLALGILSVSVVSAPRIGILSCGDELVPPESTPQPAQIRDINSTILALLVEQAGGKPVLLGISRDTLEEYHQMAKAGFADADMLVMTAGSSISTRDFTREIINSLGNPGVLQHGLAVKPGKPTLLGICDNKPVIGLPGNPVSTLLVARQILIPLIKHWLGESLRPAATVTAILTSNVASTTGREDTIPVRLFERDHQRFAEPVFGKSNLIFTVVQADGLITIPLNSNGLEAGTEVEVTLF